MYSNQSTDKIRKFLKDCDFYNFRTESPTLAKKIKSQFLETTKKSYKRALHINSYWKSVTSCGLPRTIIAIDLGGTNLKIYEADINTCTDIKIRSTDPLPFYRDITYTPEILFSELTKELNKFSSQPKDKVKELVFIFSYPIEQVIRKDGYIDAISTMINKRKKHKGIVDLQIGQAFQDYLRKNGYKNINVSVTNDSTIFCLAGKAYEIINENQYDAAINIIAGTGTNIAVAYDQTHGKNDKKLTIINTEFGNFNISSLSKFDKILNNTCELKNQYLNEKMISGAWIHQILKIMIQELTKAKIIPRNLFSNLNINKLNPAGIEKILLEKKLTPEQDLVLRFLWKEINKRGATICGISLATIMNQLREKLKKKKINIMIIETGSVIEKSYSFREHLIDAIDNELGRLEMSSQITYTLDKLDNQGALGAVIFDTFQPNDNTAKKNQRIHPRQTMV